MFSELAKRATKNARQENGCMCSATTLDPAGEFQQWLELETTTHQNPWFKARHFAVQ